MKICDYVATGELVRFQYDGMQREARFAAHGFHKTTGNELVRAYQTGGTSSSGALPAWKLLTVSKIRDLSGTATPGPTLPRDYNPADLDLRVHCHA